MPSASVKLENQGSQETLDPFQKAINIVEKKIRNLEKRKAKLEQYRVDLNAGKGLNEDQQQAVACYDSVCASLELSREFSGQFAVMLIENNKLIKKQLKKELLDRSQVELDRIKQILKIQDVLQQMGQDQARADFLTGTNGAVQIPQDRLDQLDQLFKFVTPVREEHQELDEFMVHIVNAAEHLVCLVEGRTKDVAGSTYKDLLNVVDEIAACPYPEKSSEIIEEDSHSQEPDEVEEEFAQEYTNGQIDKVTMVTSLADVPVPNISPDGPPPGLAPLSVTPVMDQDVIQEGLVASMSQIFTSVQQPSSMNHSPPPQSYLSQVIPQHVPQPPPIQQHISINDLVTPGNFDFLQESQVSNDTTSSPVYMDPAVMSIGSINNTDMLSMSSVHQQIGSELSHVSTIPTQTFTNQSYNALSSYSQAVPVYQNPPVVEITSNPPPPIPLPPQQNDQQSNSFENADNSAWDELEQSNQSSGQDDSQWTTTNEITLNGDEDKWSGGEKGSWAADEYEDGQGGQGHHQTNGQFDDRRGGYRGGRNRGFGARGFQRGRGNGNFTNGTGGGYGGGGYGGFRGGRGGGFRGIGGPRGGRGSNYRGDGGNPRGFRGVRGGNYQQGLRPNFTPQHQ